MNIELKFWITLSVSILSFLILVVSIRKKVLGTIFGFVSILSDVTAVIFMNYYDKTLLLNNYVFIMLMMIIFIILTAIILFSKYESQYDDTADQINKKYAIIVSIALYFASWGFVVFYFI